MEDTMVGASASGGAAYLIMTQLIYYLAEKDMINPSEFATHLDRATLRMEDLGIATDFEKLIHSNIEAVICHLRQSLSQKPAAQGEV